MKKVKVKPVMVTNSNKNRTKMEFEAGLGKLNQEDFQDKENGTKLVKV